MRNVLRTALLIAHALLFVTLEGQTVCLAADDGPVIQIDRRGLWDGTVRVEGQGNEVPGIDLFKEGNALCRSGDDPAYALRAYVDTGWALVTDSSSRIITGATIRWVRLHMLPARELKGDKLLLNVEARCPFTLFLDGDQILRSDTLRFAASSVSRVAVPLSFLCDGRAEVLAMRIETPPGASLASAMLGLSLHAADSDFRLHRSVMNYGVFIGINVIILLMALVIGWSERRDRAWLLLAALSLFSVLDTVCKLGGSMGALGLPANLVHALRWLRVVTVPWGMYLLILVLAEFRGALSAKRLRRYSVGIGLITFGFIALVTMYPYVVQGRNVTFNHVNNGVELAKVIVLFIFAIASVGVLAWFAIEEVRLGLRLWRTKGYERWVGAGAVAASLLTLLLAIAGGYPGMGLSSWLSVLADYCSFVAVPVSVAIYLSIRSAHHTRLVTRQRDELDREVQDRTAELRTEKERSDELLLNILPHEVAEELKNTGTAEAKHFDQATVLFSDFREFTQLSEKLSPEQLVREIDTCFKHFDGLMDKWGMEKIKTIGDAYMAAGGLPDPGKGSPADVVHAALEMQEFMEELAQKRTAQGLPVFRMRVGIHTGPVVAGIVGVKKFQYDIWGDTVNTASRMESSGEVGQRVF